MDIQLPVMDGIAATKEIRRLEISDNIGVFPSTPMTEHSQHHLGAICGDRNPFSAFGSTPPASVSASASASGSISESAAPSPVRSSVIVVALTASSLHSDRVNALAAGCNDFLTKPVSLKWLDRKIVEWGCMQALIDYDGWKRRKATDGASTGTGTGKGGKSETRAGFSVGPQAAAKNIAEKLFIDRKNNAAARAGSPAGPSVNIRAPTPRSIDEASSSTSGSTNDRSRSGVSPSPTSASSVDPTNGDFNPAASLQNARSSLADKLPQSSRPLLNTQPSTSSTSTSTCTHSEGGLSHSSSLSSIHEVSESPKMGEGKALPPATAGNGGQEAAGPDKTPSAMGRDKPLPSVPDADA